ncbi:MAG: SUF system NifU family Fe-S cluster assembly protein [Elusimicrobia bacterium]|nr:SUF system NifU family Fe-S cluster assembly protein [Elusimicrobiota bacterium]
MQGGATGGVEELYREVILDHFKTPKNRGEVANANAKAEGMNPLCGDQLSITAIVDGGEIKDVRFEGHGCAISQSAASMFTQLVKGKKVKDVRDLAAVYKKMFGVTDANGDAARFKFDDLGDLIALEGVKKYPVRIKCALLSANTILESLDQFEKKGA